jgi:hypothetical protein
MPVTDAMGYGDLANMIAGLVDATAAQKIALQKNVIPKLTTTARDALTGADLYEGLIVYNTTTHKLNVRVAAAWEAVTSA